MSQFESKFHLKAEAISFDKSHRARINFNISRYDIAVSNGKKRYSNLELAKERAAYIKRKVLQNLDKYLIEFESNSIKNGTEVIWAINKEEAINEVVKILLDNDCKMVVKSKSMTTEEIDFNEGVESVGVESVETDLGEYIVQVAGEKPYHIVTPAMHKSKEDIAALFHEHFGTPEDGTPEYLTGFVREKLREKFISAEVGVLGANFLVAEKGAIAMTENEGNGLLSGSFPKIHIVIAGIEKIIPKLNDLGLFWPLLSAHGTGQQLTVYNSVYFGPKKQNEIDGPAKMYVILLDNGRTDLFDSEYQYEALSCIRCGACLNACPIYKNIGGYTYATTYSGPIGSIISPHLLGMQNFKHLSFASSLCGRCAEVCPVKIPIPDLLLKNRKDSVEAGYSKLSENIVTKFVSVVFNNRNLMDMVSGKTKNYFMKLLPVTFVGSKRVMPPLAENSFSHQWKKSKKI